MVTRKHNQRLLSKIAHMYYEQGLSQQMIAERLRTSRPTISRMLDQARKMGIVKISIQSFNDRIASLESELESKFSLNEVAVIANDSMNKADQKKALGAVAADILQRIVKGSDVVGISWGTSLREVINGLKPTHIPGLIAVPLVGGMGQDIRYEIHSNSFVVDFSRKFGCQSWVLHAPAIVERENLKDAILGESESGEIMEQAKKANIGLVGLGALNESSTMIQTGFFSIDDFKEIREKGAIGEVCSFFFDRNGQACDIDINKRVIGVGPYDLKNIETVIAVVAGDKKEEALHAALRGQFVNILITDELTAEKVLLIESATR